jgi:hypothetical protein
MEKSGLVERTLVGRDQERRPVYAERDGCAIWKRAV